MKPGEQGMTDKEKQAVELLNRVRPRLLHGPYPQLGVKADEIVVSFLVCLEELQKMQNGDP